MYFSYNPFSVRFMHVTEDVTVQKPHQRSYA